MKRLISLMLLVAMSAGTLTSLTACNTMAGVGKDVQEVGEEVEETAEGN